MHAFLQYALYQAYGSPPLLRYIHPETLDAELGGTVSWPMQQGAWQEEYDRILRDHP